VTLTTLAIQTEAWLQEELGAQRALREVLGRIESAARAGSGAELERAAGELQEGLGRSSAREARRQALLGKLGSALVWPPGEAITLSKLAGRLSGAGVETQRLERLRTELRAVLLEVVEASRRLAALARYHRGVLEELCGLLVAGAPEPGGRLVDARG
jgi:hypothetical protein